MKYLVTPPNSNAFSDLRQTYHVPWVKLLTNSLGRTELARDQVVLLKTAANEPAVVKQTISS